MRLRTLTLLLCLPLASLACEASSVQPAPRINVDYTPLKAARTQQMIDGEVVKRLQTAHYSPIKLNDDFSRQLLGDFLDDLDSRHSVFLAGDVDYFKSRYGTRLDEALKDGDVAAAFDIFNTYQQRRIQIDQWVLAKLSNGTDSLDLGDDESVTVDREKAPWPADVEARRALWTKLLENQLINLKLDDVKAEDIHKRLTDRYNNDLERLRQAEPIDVISVYMGAYTRSYDPHTDYFTPRRSEDFEIGMNLSLQGIGAQLRSHNGYPELVRLIPGGPAAKSGKLHPTDRIIAVGQGKHGDFTDVVGMRLDEAVQLIRGEKGSVVRLQVVSDEGGRTRTVTLVRDTIELKDRAASKKIIPVQRNGETVKVGLIRLPSFYKGTADDVRKLLEELDQANVAGIVIDLRNNGGGALNEVTDLTGLLMPTAPSVQIRDAKGDVQVLGDTNNGPVYDGPLAVMVNRLSASASEIFAAAIQDYGRGLILGNQTFGKGTVQALIPLSKGRLKLTQAKFYRVSGGSTQDRGVTPDVSFPAIVDPGEIGEDALPYALPWDKIAPTRYPHTDLLHSLFPKLQAQHAERIAHDPDFQYRVKRIALARQRSEQKTLSLNLDKRRDQQQQQRQEALKLANAHRKAIGKKPFADYDAFQDSETSESPQEEAGSAAPADRETDAYQKESAEILLDMVRLLQQKTADRA